MCDSLGKVRLLSTLWVCLFPEKWFSRNYFPNFPVFFCHLKSWSTENTFRSTENTYLVWFPRKCFSFILGGKHFPEVVKNLEMSYYLLIISNLILKLLIAIYILFWIFIFQFHPLEFNFYINFGPHFYFAFPLPFFNWNFLSIKFGSHSFDCYLFYLK